MVDRANRVLRNARNVVLGAENRKEISGFTLSSVTQRFYRSAMESIQSGPSQVSKQILEEKLDVLDKNFIRISRTEYKDGAVKDRNSSTIVSVVNGDESSTNFDFISNGVTADQIVASGKVPVAVKGQMKESFERIRQLSKEEIRQGLWINVFPLLLGVPWDSTDVFVHIGKAESGEIRADIIELVSKNKKRIRLFFNECTHLLLMTTVEEKGTGSGAKTTNYYSDYNEMDGILLARKIVSESEFSILTQAEFLGQKIYPRTTRRIKERTIRGFEINPKFPPDNFEIAGRKWSRSISDP
jgi:hypothetical protein